MTENLLHQTRFDQPSEEARQATWQRHVMTVLWVLLGVFFVTTGVFLWAEANGWLHSTDSQAPASWPADQP